MTGLRLTRSVSTQAAEDARTAQDAASTATAAAADAESARDLAEQYASQTGAGRPGPSLWLDFARDYYAWQPTGGADGLPTAKPVREFQDLPSFLSDIGGSFTRASTATYFDSSGVMQTAAIDEARLDHVYDSASGVWVPAGYLSEPSRTNIALYSEDFTDAVWGKTRCSVVSGATTGLDGSATAQKIVEDTSASTTHYIRQDTGTAISAGTDYCVNAIVKAGERTRGSIWVFGLSYGRIQVDFDLSTESTTTNAPVGGGYTPVIVGSGLDNLGGGWYRVWVSGNTDLTGNVEIYVFLEDDSGGINYTGDGSSGLYCDGIQVEEGSYPTSYIPTTSATVTRAADDLSMPADGWLKAGVGTIAADARYNGGSQYQIAARAVFQISESGSTDKQVTAYNSSGSAIAFSVNNNGNQCFLRPAESEETFAFAAAYKENDFALSKDGGAALTDTSGTVPELRLLNVGKYDSGVYLGGHVKSFSYYPTRLPDADLQSLSS